MRSPDAGDDGEDEDDYNEWLERPYSLEGYVDAFNEILTSRDEICRQLAHRHMVALCELFEDWALEQDCPKAESIQLRCWSADLRHVADDVGPGWDPPTLKLMSALGFFGRAILGEPLPERIA